MWGLAQRVACVDAIDLPARSGARRRQRTDRAPPRMGSRRRTIIVVVPEPLDAYESSMPRSALQEVDVDHCDALASMASLLNPLASTSPTAIGLERPARLAGKQ